MVRKGLTERLLRCLRLSSQLLAGLSYAHAANVMHRDLNPSNLLVNADCSLKICDFGLARSFDKDALMSDYVVTRWYRSPELLLGARRYDFGVDLWAVGCILAEMLGRRAIFPGRDPVHQLSLVCKVVGMPRDEDLNFLPSQAARDYVRKMPQRRGRSPAQPSGGESSLHIDRPAVQSGLKCPALRFTAPAGLPQ